MDAYVMDSNSYEHDEEGYLKNLSDWNKDLAELIAKDEKIDMTPEHWEVVNFLRDYYEEYQVAPAIRVLVKAMKKTFGLRRAIKNISISCSLMARRSKPVRSPACQSRPAACETGQLA